MWSAYCFHFLEGGDHPPLPRVEGVDSDGLDLGDDGLDGLRGEGPEHELPELGVVGALVEEYGLLPQHPLFACRECGLEEMSSRNKNLLCCFWACDHHAGASQYVSLEYGTVPAKASLVFPA